MRRRANYGDNVSWRGGRAPLFKGYGWDIYKEDTDSRVVAFGHHKACQGTGHTANSAMNCWWLQDIKQECVVCGVKVPENIQALITLYVYGKETA